MNLIPRTAELPLRNHLSAFPVVALLGPRQVGKTTLALQLANDLEKPAKYLDLELHSDRAKLSEAELYLEGQAGTLTILDEVQRVPELFPLLRSLVDKRIRSGERTAQFLVLGSASKDLLRQSSESLAGRIAYLELSPLTWVELAGSSSLDIEDHWLRGGFPLSALASSDTLSWQWRTQFISTYLERDIPQLGPKLPAERMRRLWTMLALGQGDPLNASKLAANLDISGTTVRHYLDILSDLYMVRLLKPWAGNLRKRLIRTPKIYVRDSGLMHCLANIPNRDTLLSHPAYGRSWEGYVIENITSLLPDTWSETYYRSSAGAEIDLVLEGPGENRVAIEIKRTLSPKLSKGFRVASEDIQATRRIFVTPGGDRFPLSRDTEAIPLRHLLTDIQEEAFL